MSTRIDFPSYSGGYSQGYVLIDVSRPFGSAFAVGETMTVTARFYVTGGSTVYQVECFLSDTGYATSRILQRQKTVTIAKGKNAAVEFDVKFNSRSAGKSMFMMFEWVNNNGQSVHTDADNAYKFSSVQTTAPTISAVALDDISATTVGSQSPLD